jgi:hypothetical protein
MQEDFFKAEKFGFCCFDCSIFPYKSISYDIFSDGIFLDFFWVWGGFLMRFEKNFATRYYLGRQCDANDVSNLGVNYAFSIRDRKISTRDVKNSFFSKIVCVFK